MWNRSLVVIALTIPLTIVMSGCSNTTSPASSSASPAAPAVGNAASGETTAPVSKEAAQMQKDQDEAAARVMKKRGMTPNP